MGFPIEVAEAGDAPAGFDSDVEITPIGHGVPVRIRTSDPYDQWESVNVIRGRANGTVSAYAHAKLGDITGEQFRQLAALQRELGADVRVTNRQNLVFRGLAEADLRTFYDGLAEVDMTSPGAELIRDVVACPGADTCNLGITQSRGLAKAITQALEDEGLAEVGGIRINISGCPNSCGQHHVADIGFQGVEKREHGRSAPGYLMLLGGLRRPGTDSLRSKGRSSAGQVDPRGRDQDRETIHPGAGCLRAVPRMDRESPAARRKSLLR